jgi:hypothetical protein
MPLNTALSAVDDVSYYGGGKNFQHIREQIKISPCSAGFKFVPLMDGKKWRDYVSQMEKAMACSLGRNLRVL